MRNDLLYLTDIIEAADAIAEFIGEAAANLSPEFKAQQAAIPWRTIVAFRNVMVHAYFSIQLGIIWETALSDVPVLRRQVARILTDEFS